MTIKRSNCAAAGVATWSMLLMVTGSGTVSAQHFDVLVERMTANW